METTVVNQVRALDPLKTPANTARYQPDAYPLNVMLNTLADIFDEARRNHPRRLVGIWENLMDLINSSA